MEFYKLFHKKIDYHSLLEWIDRGFGPERWKLHDVKVEKAFYRLMLSFNVVNKVMGKLQR